MLACQWVNQSKLADFLYCTVRVFIITDTSTRARHQETEVEVYHNLALNVK